MTNSHTLSFSFKCSENEDEFHLLFPSQIASIDGDIPQDTPDDDGIAVRLALILAGSLCFDVTVSAEALRKRELAALESAELSVANINFGVSDEIQTLYDRLSFL